MASSTVVHETIESGQATVSALRLEPATSLAEVYLPDVGLRSIECENHHLVPEEPKVRNDLVRCDGVAEVAGL